MTEKYLHPIEELLSIMRALRDPQSGCPWDQKQTFKTIAPYTIEEAYEVADAIARDDFDDLCDELGDLLLQVVYHAEMAAELDQFEFADVVRSICTKMTRRHPHVFARDCYQNNGTLEKEWERIKQQERAEKPGANNDSSIMANVPLGLPPLLRARKLQKKAAQVNFDWTSAALVLDKVQEELNEVKAVLDTHQETARLEEEIGDLLFSVVNVCRHLKVDAELAVQTANTKFETRFRLVETLAQERELILADLNEKELDELWEQAKAVMANGRN